MYRWEKYVRTNTNEKSFTAYATQCSIQRRIALAYIIQIHCSADIEITISVEASCQLCTLIVKIILNIKASTQVGREGWRGTLIVLNGMTGATQFHGLLALVGNHCQH